MSRKVELCFKVKVSLDVDEGVTMQEVVDNLTCEINAPPVDAGYNVTDTEILDYQVVDSK